MTRRIFQDELHVHFVTFSCFHRRNALLLDHCKRIVISQLTASLDSFHALCLGYVVMPNHVHGLLWFQQPNQLSGFLNRWKSGSSHAIKRYLQEEQPEYWTALGELTSIWQARYHDFNIDSRGKIEQKLDYMHLNPVRAGLVQRTTDWPWSSARWYVERKTVGVPIEWPPGI